MRSARLLRLCFALLAALLFAGCGRQDLYTNLDEKEANEMIAVLQRQRIDVGKEPATEENRFKITVENGRFADAVAVLKSQGFPRDKFANMGEVFKKSGLVSSPTEERIRFMNALADSLSETITHIDGVLTARVHIVLPNNDPLADKVQPSSAAVFIKHSPTADVESFIPQIKNLVINSIEGLAYDKVSVAAVAAEEFTGRNQLPADTTRVLGIEMSPSSIGRFWTIIGILGFLLVATIAGSLAVMIRRGWQPLAREKASAPALTSVANQ